MHMPVLDREQIHEFRSNVDFLDPIQSLLNFRPIKESKNWANVFCSLVLENTCCSVLHDLYFLMALSRQI